MPFRSRVGRGICLLVALATPLVSQTQVFGESGSAKAAFVRTLDVSQQINGDLLGQVVDHQGRPQAITQVAVFQNNQAVGYAKTDQAGRFNIRGLKPGVYQIRSAVAAGTVRVWAPRTAPPVAQQAVLLVGNGAAIRGQMHGGVYGPAIRGAIAGGLITGLTYWAIDHNNDDAS